MTTATRKKSIREAIQDKLEAQIPCTSAMATREWHMTEQSHDHGNTLRGYQKRTHRARVTQMELNDYCLCKPPKRQSNSLGVRSQLGSCCASPSLVLSPQRSRLPSGGRYLKAHTCLARPHSIILLGPQDSGRCVSQDVDQDKLSRSRVRRSYICTVSTLCPHQCRPPYFCQESTSTPPV